MKFIILAIAILMAGTAFADDFADRLQAGKQALRSADGKAYEQSLGPIIGTAMRECLPPDSPHQPGDFALVGYVTTSGVVFSIEVEPSTAVSRCLAEKISKAALPAPPSAPIGFKAFPVTIEMQVVP